MALGAFALAEAAASPYLAYRQPVYIAASFAGVLALILMVGQPLLAAGLLPGLGASRSRRVHVVLGLLTAALVSVHVGGLWITSPPDVVDALTFTSPAPFSAWGVVAMWALVAAACAAALRHGRARRLVHGALVSVAVGTTLPHAWLIEGTMGGVSKALLLLAALAALGWAIRTRRTLRLLRLPRAGRAAR
ncbi:MAG: ferric reductase [Pseudomonadota bacterium]